MTALAAQERQFQVSINPLWPGEKLNAKAQGETRWGRHTRAWRTETHSPESLCQRITGEGCSFCAVLKEPWRVNHNFQSLQVLASDHDEGTTIEALLEDPLIRDKCSFIYETPSSSERLRKFRAVFILDQAITDPGLVSLAYQALIWHFANGAPDAEADKACKDPVRFFYGRVSAPHAFLGNILPLTKLQELIEEFLANGQDPASRTATTQNGSGYTYPRTSGYDPHRGSQLAPEDQKALAQFMVGKGLVLGPDGRFNGPCLFHECNCSGALYASSKTGSWYCFCAHHPGINHGSVGALTDVGFTPAHARVAVSLTWEEVKRAVDHDPTQPFYRERAYDEDVRKTVKGDNSLYYFPDKPFKPRKRGNKKPSAIWDLCCEQIPAPSGHRPVVDGCVWISRKDNYGVAGDVYASTWFNSVNEAHKRRTMLKHLITTFSKSDTYYRTIPSDDWDEHRHEALRKAIERAGGRYYAIDNRLSRGFWAYFATAPGPGFELADDLVPLLLAAVKGIRVPAEKPKNGKFRPTRASHEFKQAIDTRPADDDAGKLTLIARRKGGLITSNWKLNCAKRGNATSSSTPSFVLCPGSASGLFWIPPIPTRNCLILR
jgi:hypothetical protein